MRHELHVTCERCWMRHDLARRIDDERETHVHLICHRCEEPLVGYLYGNNRACDGRCAEKIEERERFDYVAVPDWYQHLKDKERGHDDIA